VKERIEQALAEHTLGLSILEISRIIGVHRHTVRKYVDELVSEGKVFQRDVGTIKLHYSARKLPEKDRSLLKKMKRRAG